MSVTGVVRSRVAVSLDLYFAAAAEWSTRRRWSNLKAINATSFRRVYHQYTILYYTRCLNALFHYITAYRTYICAVVHKIDGINKRSEVINSRTKHCKYYYMLLGVRMPNARLSIHYTRKKIARNPKTRRDIGQRSPG